MTSDRRVLISPDQNWVMAENGPMRLVIRAWSDGRFQTTPAIEAANFSFSCLEQVAGHLRLLKGKPPDTGLDSLPLLCQNMVNSVQCVGDPDLTSMASVAGAIADAVADRLAQKIWPRAKDAGNVKIIVDNGGDLAIRLAGKETASVGLRTDLNTTELSHTMVLDSDKHGFGVNTSGMGGRSFTRGIASAATVLAASSARADAAATAIANACFHPDPNIVQVRAGQLDPHTDIPDIPVTVHAGNLKASTIKKALGAALDKAGKLRDKGLIYGAFIVCGGLTTATRPFDHARIVPAAQSRLTPL